jgi:SAM-dependent methyltransferase
MSDERDIDRLAADALAAGEATGWFEPLYAANAAAGTTPPWNHDGPRPLLEAWARERGVRDDGGRRRAAVVGAGLGADAEYVASLGFDTLGFDISATAVRLAGERSTHDNARYEVGDLLDLPASWVGAFDLVVESFTVQALPDPPRADAIAAISRLVAPGGTLLAIAYALPDGDPPAPEGPPWRLRRAEMEAFATAVDPPLRIVELALHTDTDWPFWRVELAAPPATPAA